MVDLMMTTLKKGFDSQSSFEKKKMEKKLCGVMMLIGLPMLNHSCEPGMNPTWLWYMIFFICCWIPLAKISLRIFASIFVKVNGL